MIFGKELALRTVTKAAIEPITTKRAENFMIEEDSECVDLRSLATNDQELIEPKAGCTPKLVGGVSRR